MFTPKNYLRCRWRELSQEVPWNLNLIFNNLNDGSEARIWPLMMSRRVFVKAKITTVRELDHYLLDFFEMNGGRIQELHIFYCLLNDTFFEVLKTMPKLKKIILYETRMAQSLPEPKFLRLPPLNKLQTLEVVACGFRILKYFKHANLTAFKIFFAMNVETAEPLLDFFASQENLKSLALRSVRDMKLQLFQIPNSYDMIPFTLKKLSLLEFRFRTTPNDYNNLLVFLQIHSKTIEELEVGRSFPNFIFEFIFSKFRKLRLLKIYTKSIPSDMEVYQRLKFNKSVTKLVAVGDLLSDAEPLKEIFLHLPNIETLILTRSFDAAVKLAAIHLPHLKHLTIEESIDTLCLNEVKFPHLETLHIGRIHHPIDWLDVFDVFNNVIDWIAFTSNNPNITELHIKSVNPTMFNIKAITKNLKLRELRIGTKICADKKFFHAIRENCNHLEMLCIPRDSLKVKVSKITDIRALHFYEDAGLEFPKRTDGEMWIRKDYVNTGLIIQ